MKKSEREKPVKAVIDTNVLVSGLFAESGTVAELMGLWFDGEFEMMTSEKILSELYRVLHKPTIQRLDSLKGGIQPVVQNIDDPQMFLIHIF